MGVCLPLSFLASDLALEWVSQELLLILEEYWEAHPDLHGVPIYQASALATRALSIFQTYIEMMNDDIKLAFQVNKP